MKRNSTDIKFCLNEMVIVEKSKKVCIQYYEVVSISIDRPYAVITTVEKKRIYINAVLSEIIKDLPQIFFLCNQSTILNLLYIVMLEKKNTTFLVHSVIGAIFQVSRRNIKAFEKNFLLAKETSQCMKCSSCKLVSTCNISETKKTNHVK